MKFQIQYINKKKKYGFIGMNDSSHKHCKVEWNHKKHPEHTIEVYKKLPKEVRVATIRHEMCEKYLENTKHQGYHQAHANALRFEELDKPFPTDRIKERLKKMGFKIK